MKNSQCLSCYEELSEDEIDFHPKCSKKIFDSPTPPELPYTDLDILSLAEKIIKTQTTITGVQPKLSLGLEKLEGKDVPDRFTIVGVLRNYILKPQSDQYPFLPEIEDLTMNLAKIVKIKTVKHSLIRLKSGQLAYITKRIDRENGRKIHMEDMCQLTKRLTEQKYKGSYEQIAKVILEHSIYPGFDVISFYELVLFSFLVGNNDMHLKNFSLIKHKKEGYQLSPAYDLVASELVVEGDDEELALNINGKKKKLKKEDFITAMKGAKIEDAAIENLFKTFEKSIKSWDNIISNSFLPENLKTKYQEMITKKQKQIGIGEKSDDQ